MAVDQREIRVDGRHGPRIGGRLEEPPLGELFRQLSDDATHLIRQEVALGKAELRETASALGRDAVKVGAALTFVWLGALAAVAFMIVGLGALIGNFWLAALIVSVVLLGIGATLGKQAMDDFKHRDLKPTQTIETLRADAEWAKREATTVKQEWKA